MDAPLAQGQPFVGRYAVDVAGFESVALPTLAPTATPAAAPQPGQPPRIGARLFVIDEVGEPLTLALAQMSTWLLHVTSGASLGCLPTSPAGGLLRLLLVLALVMACPAQHGGTRSLTEPT